MSDQHNQTPQQNNQNPTEYPQYTTPPQQSSQGFVPPQQPYNQPPQGNVPPQQPYGQPYGQPPYGQPPQPPYGQPPAYQPIQSDNTKVFSILAYIGILWLVGLIAEPHNPRVKFHVNQGIILTILAVALSVVISIISAILFAISPVLFVISSLLWFAESVVVIVLMVLGIINASKGIEKPLPVIGSLFTVVK